MSVKNKQNDATRLQRSFNYRNLGKTEDDIIESQVCDLTRLGYLQLVVSSTLSLTLFQKYRHENEQSSIPIKAIIIAIFMFVCGLILIVMGFLLSFNLIDTQYSDQSWTLIILGILVLLPGVYHVRIVILAWRHCGNYTCNDILS